MSRGQPREMNRSCLYQSVIFICSAPLNDKTPKLIEDLSKKFFVRSNGSSKHFIEDCHAIICSKVFMCVLDADTLSDNHFLSLLGVAIAYDIPIIPIRQIGYALPHPLPKYFMETEIIDRSQPNQISIDNEYLHTVTTLDHALRVLFLQSMAYHKNIHNKCMSNIIRMINATQDQSSMALQIRYCNFESKPSAKTDANQVLTIKPWSPHIQLETEKRIDKTKSSSPVPNNFNQTIKKGKKNHKAISTNDKETDSKKVPKARSSTFASLNLHKNQIRRQSSLPNITTNYLVANPKENSIPTIYHFPLSPKSMMRKPSTSPRLSIIDDDIPFIHLSRTCTPFDLTRNDEELEDYYDVPKIVKAKDEST